MTAEDLAEFSCDIEAPEKIVYKNGGDPIDVYYAASGAKVR